MAVRRLQALVLLTAFAGFAVGGALLAQGQSQGRGGGQGRQSDAGKRTESGTAVTVQFGFSTGDREVVSAYFAKYSPGLPPGLAKRDDLPPGLEKQLRRNGALPPGLQKKLQPFPVALDRQLVRLPPDYHRFVLGAHILVVNSKTNVVVDFALNIAR